MPVDLSAARAFVAVATAGGFRDAAQATGISASSLSGAVKRLEGRLGVRLLNRTTRSVVATEAGARLLERLQVAMADVEAALDRANDYRETPSGMIRLNVPINAARRIFRASESRSWPSMDSWTSWRPAVMPASAMTSG